MDSYDKNMVDTTSNSDTDSETCSYTSGSIDEDIDIMTFFSKKELCYYKMIDKFFSNCDDKAIQKMVDIIEGKCDISLRVIDWFVNKFTKKRIDKNTVSFDYFNIRISYKAQLKSYKKHYFDPFRRRQKFKYYYNFSSELNEKKCIYTTLGQLNFFKWAIANDIINVVEQNLLFISSAMNISNMENKRKKQTVQPVEQKTIQPVKQEEKISKQILLVFN